MAAAPLLETRALTRHFGGLVAVDDVSFSVARGVVAALIGPNGAGKSTFFKMLAGELRPTRGDVFFKGERITGLGPTRICQRGIAKSYQTTQVFPHLTVAENIVIAALARTRGPFRLDLFRTLGGVRGLPGRVERVMAAVHLTERSDVRAGDLAYGERRRLELGLALATEPELLLLDEPTAGMSPEETKDTVAHIKELRRSVTIVIVEHDMDVVFELADRITVMHEGRAIAEGPPEAIRAHPEVRRAYLGGVL